MSDLDSIDRLLRERGAAARSAVRTGLDRADLRRRGDRQRRRQQAASSLVLAVAVLGVGALAAHARGPVAGDVTAIGGAAGGAGGAPVPAPVGAPAATSGTTAPPPPPARSPSTTIPAEEEAATAGSRPARSTTTGTATATGRTPPGTTPDIGAVDFREGFAYPEDTCSDLTAPGGALTVHGGAAVLDGSRALWVTDVTYGQVTSAPGDEAIVTVACAEGHGAPRAWLYAADGAAPGGARRVSVVQPDDTSRRTLDQQGIGPLRLNRVRAADAVVTIEWTATRTASGTTAAVTVTVRLRWAGTSWEQAAPVVVTAPPG